MAKLILLRHGQSEWNKKNLFTGWVDVPLSPEGIEEAQRASKELKNFSIERIFTSTLIRGIMTALLAMSAHPSGKVPVIVHPTHDKQGQWSTCYSESAQREMIPMVCAWELNERMYGELQGCNKDEIRARYGNEQVHIWRRSYTISPPQGESLQMTAARTLPFFQQAIFPCLEQGENVLVAAHGNSLRSIVMDIERLSEQEVLQLEIPTGKALFYEYHAGKFRKQERH